MRDRLMVCLEVAFRHYLECTIGKKVGFRVVIDDVTCIAPMAIEWNLLENFDFHCQLPPLTFFITAFSVTVSGSEELTTYRV